MMKHVLWAISISFATFFTAFADHFTRHVNPFIGTAATGHTFPGATVPFGLVQPGPVTGAVGWQYCSEYLHSDSLIFGFSQTHLNGTGCCDLGNILLMPTDGFERMVRDTVGLAQRNDRLNAYGSQKQGEVARPGYYAVELPDARARVQITATPHVAYYRIHFEDEARPQIYLDFQHSPAWNWAQYHSQMKSCEWAWDNSQTLSGRIRNQVWVDKEVHFVIHFSRPMQRLNVLNPRPHNKGARMLADFNLEKGEPLEIKVALSSTSAGAAMRNLCAELPAWDFDACVQRADGMWENYLRRIQVEGTPDELANFYTAFYHTLIQPNNIADVDGYYLDSRGRYVRAEGGNEFFSTLSLWDTYRAAHPFYCLFVPEKVDAFVRSIVAQGESQGYLPIWALWGKETHTMIGNHAVSVIAEAYRKGFRGFDAERAFAAIKHTLTHNHPEKTDWDIYNRYGYYPYDLVKLESVSQTLEMCYDDYAASDFARRLGKTDDARFFARRAANYRNLFDTTTGLMRPKDSRGQWRTPFHPNAVAHAESGVGDYTEGNAWQYTWHVQHDVPAFIRMMGGKEKFVTKLDSLFTTELGATFLPDVSGLIGQYAHGNEPSHHVVYLYALAGRPDRTQELVRQICTTQYRPTAEGLCGNDDCGQMSAWYMFSAMGFYPLDPVSGNYVIGAPQLSHFRLQLPNGRTLEIEAQHLSAENRYVQSVILNGRRLTAPTISHETLLRGGKLTFVMGNQPQK